MKIEITRGGSTEWAQFVTALLPMLWHLLKPETAPMPAPVPAPLAALASWLKQTQHPSDDDAADTTYEAGRRDEEKLWEGWADAIQRRMDMLTEQSLSDTAALSREISVLRERCRMLEIAAASRGRSVTPDAVIQERLHQEVDINAK